MTYSLKQAAEATGRSKPTILRAIQKGRISAKKHEITAEWEIEPAELHRLYPPITRNSESSLQTDAMKHHVTVKNHAETEGGRDEIRALRDLLAEREKRLFDKDEVIRDLRGRLDQESEERRRVQTQLSALLTEQKTSPPLKVRWWKKLFR